MNAFSHAYSLILCTLSINDLAIGNRDKPLNVREKLVHESCTAIPVLHLRLLHPLEDPGDVGVQRYRDYHDCNADKRRPSQNIVKGYEGQGDLKPCALTALWKDEDVW